MINQTYLDTAIKIRKEYIKISNELLTYSDKLTQLLSNVESNIPALEDIQKKLNNGEYTDKKIFERDFNDKSIKIEVEIEKIKTIYQTLNTKLENLGKEEEALYQTLKNVYPTLSDDDMRNIMKEKVFDIEG